MTPPPEQDTWTTRFVSAKPEPQGDRWVSIGMSAPGYFAWLRALCDSPVGRRKAALLGAQVFHVRPEVIAGILDGTIKSETQGDEVVVHIPRSIATPENIRLHASDQPCGSEPERGIEYEIATLSAMDGLPTFPWRFWEDGSWHVLKDASGRELARLRLASLESWEEARKVLSLLQNAALLFQAVTAATRFRPSEKALRDQAPEVFDMLREAESEAVNS